MINQSNELPNLKGSNSSVFGLHHVLNLAFFYLLCWYITAAPVFDCVILVSFCIREGKFAVRLVCSWYSKRKRNVFCDIASLHDIQATCSHPYKTWHTETLECLDDPPPPATRWDTFNRLGHCADHRHPAFLNQMWAWIKRQLSLLSSLQNNNSQRTALGGSVML